MTAKGKVFTYYKRVYLVFFCLFIYVLKADTFIWQGDRNDNFGNERNWSQELGSGDIPDGNDRASFLPGADRYRIDLGGNPRTVNSISLETDGSTGSNGYNWEFLNQTLTVGANDGLWRAIGWKHTTNTAGSITIGGNIAFLSTASRAFHFIGGTHGAYNLILNNGLQGSGKIELDTYSDDDTLTLKSQNSYSGEVVLDAGILVTEHTDPFPNAFFSVNNEDWSFNYVSGTTIALSSVTNYAFPVLSGKSLTIEAVGDTYKQFTGGGTLNLNNRSSGSSDVFFTDTSSFNGTLNLNTSSSTFSGGIGFPNAFVSLSSSHTLNTNRDTSFAGLVGGGTLNLNASVVSIGGAGPTVANTLSSKITGSGVVAFAGGSKILNITNNSNTFSGLVRVTSGDELNLSATALQYATLDLNALNTPLVISANNTKLGALLSDIDVVLNKNLEIGSNNSSCSMSGEFSGQGTLTKIGTGSFTFNGVNTSLGKTSIQSGVLFGESSYVGDLELQSIVALDVLGNENQQVSVGGTLSLGNSSALRINSSGTQTESYYILMRYNALVGQFDQVDGVPAGYFIDYSFNDGSSTNNIALVRDTTPPVVTLNGAESVTLPFQTDWVDPGVTAIDNLDDVVNVSIDINSLDVQTVGSYNVNYTATDAAGNSTIKTRTIHIKPRPTLTKFDWIISKSPDKVKAHVIDLTLSEPLSGLTVDDFQVSFAGEILAKALWVIDETNYRLIYNPVVGDGEFSVHLPMNVRTNAEGIGNAPSATLTKVLDQTAPTILINGGNGLRIAYGGDYVELGATAADSLDGPVNVTIGGDVVNTAVPGEYVVTYRAVDSVGNVATANRIVEVIDRVAPVITLNDALVLTVEAGDTYIDPGATALDEIDGEVEVTVGGDVVNTLEVGEYVITYNAFDAQGNGRIAIRRVQVIDSTAPQITLNGENSMNIDLGAPYIEPSATASDVVDGYTAVTIGGDVIVDTSFPGTYTISYTSEDMVGNTSTVYRTVTVSDLSAPTILSIESSVDTTNADSVTCQITFSEEVVGVDASDFLVSFPGEIGSFPGEVGNLVVNGNGSVYTFTVYNISGDGTLTLALNQGYSISDDAGNLLEPSTVEGSVIIDNTPPVITISNGEPYIIGAGSEAYEFYPNPKATDSREGSVGVSIVSNTVDLSTIGSYEVVYIASDSLGNTAQKTLEVDVVDETRPVVTLNGDRNIVIEFGSEYVELGATAIDDVDGELEVTVAGETVRTDVFTVFGVQYRATDSAGNRGSAYRTVEIRDTTAPVITLNGEAHITLGKGQEYIELGATATDATFGSESAQVGGDTVNTQEVGVYTVTYDATDLRMNQAIQQTRTITVLDKAPPSDILLSPSVIAENSASSSIVGRLTAIDADNTSGFTYSLVTGEGDEENQLFTIGGQDGDQILLNTDNYDYETHALSSIRVEVTDEEGISFEKALTITALNQLEPGNWEDIQQLVPPASAEGDLFGSAVVVKDNFAFVSAVNADDKGAVYVYLKGAQGWTEFQKIQPSDLIDDVKFGSSIAYDGTTLVITLASVAASTEAVYIYEYEGNAFQQTAKLEPTNLSQNAGFGSSIAVNNRTVLVGAPRDDQNGSNAGIVYVYQSSESGNSWELATTLAPEQPAPNALFGQHMTFDGTDAIVSTVGTNNLYHFTYDSNTWSQTQSWTISADLTEDVLAMTELVSEGDLLAIGTIVQNNSVLGFGYEVQTYDRKADGAWSYAETLSPPGLTSSQKFGRQMSLSDGRLFISNAASEGADTVYVFSYNSSWSQTHQLNVTLGTDSDYFGNSLCADGKTLFIGARNNDDIAAEAGKVFTLEYQPAPPTDITFRGATSIPEDLLSIIGSFTTFDADEDSGFSYSLVNGEGDEFNEFFTIEDEFLRVFKSFDHETQPSVSFRVEVVDGDGQTFSKAFTINITNILSDDDDGDGLVEGAEDYFKTDPLNPDTDGDGISDDAEINDWKTDPLDPFNTPLIRIKEINSETGRTTLELQIEDNTSCKVLYTTTLNNEDWQSIEGGIQGTGELIEVDVPTPDSACAFYRIVLE